MESREPAVHSEGEANVKEIRQPFTQANDSVPEHYRKQLGRKPDAAEVVFFDGSGKGWIAWWGRGPFTAEMTRDIYRGNEGVKPPLGQPGDWTEVDGERVRIAAVRVDRVGDGWHWTYSVETAERG